MDDEAVTALLMTLESHSDFHYQLIGILLSITKALPQESQPSIAKSLVDLIENHRENLKELNILHSKFRKGLINGE